MYKIEMVGMEIGLEREDNGDVDKLDDTRRDREGAIL